MSYPEVRLGGVALNGPLLEWPQVPGVEPVQVTLTVTADRADAIRGMLGAPQVLSLKGPRRDREVQQVYPLLVLPGPNDALYDVLISDRRWLFPFASVNYRMNVRRSTGDTALFSTGANPEVADVDEELAWVKATLYPPDDPQRPWSGREALQAVLEDLVGSDYVLPSKFPGTEIVDLELADQGDAALDRVLGYLAGYSVVPNDAGQIVVTNQLDQSERAVYERTRLRQQERGVYARLVDKRALRPRYVRVLFTPECEVRFTYTESGTATSDSATLKQVVEVPDIDGIELNGKRVGPGSYALASDVYSTWGTHAGPNLLVTRAISQALLRRHAMAEFREIEDEFSRDPDGTVNGVWANRLRAAVEAFRELFQIDETFMGRLEQVLARRVAVLNTATMARPQAPIYTDWFRRPSEIGLQRGDLGDNSVGWGVSGYAVNLADAKAAPGTVRVVNDSGVISVKPRERDLYGYASNTLWGTPTGAYPSQNAGEANRSALDALARWEGAELDSSFNLSVILTVIPGTPNNNDRFWAYDVYPGFAYNTFGLVAEECTGPPMTIRILPGLLTARFAWTDATGQQIVGAIKGEAEYPDAPTLLNKTDLVGLATAVAASVYQPLVDSIEGTAVVDHDPALVPTGAVRRVSTVVNSGEVVTRVDFGTPPAAQDFFRFLPASTRKALLGSLP